MALEDTCIFNNHMDSNVLPVVSTIGNNLDAKTGTAIVAGNFSNAIDFPSTGDRIYQTTDQPGIDINQGEFGMWYKPDNNIVNGGQGSGKNIDVIYWWDGVGANFDQFTFGFFNSVGCRWAIGVNGVNHTFDTTNVNLTGGIWNYILLRWDVAHATKKRRIYTGDASSISEDASDNVAWATGTFDVPVLFGSRLGSSVVVQSAIDEPKIFNDASDANHALIVANRNFAGFPAVGGFRLLDGALNTPMIDQGILN